MTPARRWLLVAVVAVLVTAPAALLAHWPASASNLTAVELRAKIGASAKLGWSGQATTRGTLQVPKTDSFSGLAGLLSEDTDLRVWWRDDTHWRVDQTRVSGESDQYRYGGLVTTWRFESEQASITPYSPVRLPDVSDVLPSTLAARMLSGARPAELTRLPAQRVAGHNSAGLRLNPADPRSTIGHVDIWADESSGVPTRVQVYAAGRPRLPVLSTRLIELHVGPPAESVTKFQAPDGVRASFHEVIDEAAGANAFAPFIPPDSIAGLHRSGSLDKRGAVGVYGRGPTAIIAIPLRDEVASALRDQLRKSRSSTETTGGTGLAVGPLTVLLPDGRRGAVLLAGTVTPATLELAAADVRAHGQFFR
ncbi:MAG: hypothetical protein ABI873_09085 [Marmoricola sp.]